MAYEKPPRCAIVTVVGLLFLLAIDCRAQEQRQDHTCTVGVAGAFALPKGEDGGNFNSGWGLQAGGGFAVLRTAERRGSSVYITGNFMYEKFGATAAALEVAKNLNPTQLANATSAHGAFTTVTLDPTVRYALNRRFSVYGSGGFGWLRRAVGFNGANPATLLQSSGVTLDRLHSNSGVFDLGGGANFGLRKNGGLMVFTEIRVYRGLAINNGSTLLPLSLGIRW